MVTSIFGDCPILPSLATQTSTSTKRMLQGPGRSPQPQPFVGIFVGTGRINILLTYGIFFRKCSDMIAAGPTKELNSLRLARQVPFEVNHRFDHRYVLLAILRRNRGCGLAHVVRMMMAVGVEQHLDRHAEKA
jgi:hypothetical protein